MKRGIERWLAAGLLAVGANAIGAPITLQQDFDNLAASGWTIVNNSAPGGTTNWFQGNAGVFAGQAGAANSYAGANFLSTGPLGGTISTWLISPEIQFASQILTFYTRTDADPARIFGDGLRVLACTSGACGAPSDFAEILGINTANAAGGYAQSWTQFVALLGSVGTGRIAFEYTVGPRALANYIGIDSVRIFVPEPGSLALLGGALLAVVVVRRRAGRIANAAAVAVAVAATAAAGDAAADASGQMSFPNVRVVNAQGAYATPDAAGAGGFRAYKDEDTGEFMEPSIDQAAALDAAMPAALRKPPRKALSVTRHPNGMIEMRLGRDFLSYSVARREHSGGLSQACVQGEELAVALVASTAAKQGGVQ